MEDPCGIGGFRGGGEPNIKQIVKKIGEKSEKAVKSRKNRIFFIENGFKGIISKFWDFFYYWSDLTEIFTQYVCKIEKKNENFSI